jgi:glycosyltransferase involved in cell wall biosynthesis
LLSEAFLKSKTPQFSGRLGVQQRVLPDYRAPFFELLAQRCKGGMEVFAGAPRFSEGIHPVIEPRFPVCSFAKNIHILDGPAYLCYQTGLTRWLSTLNPDALIVEANPRYLSTSQAVEWMHRRSRPVIGWGLGAPPMTGRFASIRLKRRRTFLTKFDALIAYSRRGAREYAQFGIPEAKIFTATNAAGPAPDHPLPSRRTEASGHPFILFVGRLQERKRVDLLLKACAKLEHQPRLVIAGDGPERMNLEAHAKEDFPATEFIGPKRGLELKPYFMEADLFVLPGTGGLAVQEAMSYGLPVIVARGDGTQDDLVCEANGWQVPPDDLPALVQTMQQALSDVGRLRRMGVESYRIVAEEINIEKMTEVFVAALNSL